MLISITRRQQRRRQERLRNTLGVLLLQHRLQPDRTDEFPHRILALDTGRRMLAFAQHDESLPTLAVDLDEISDCRLWKESKGMTFTGSNPLGRTPEHVSAIGLVIIRPNQELIKIPLYTEILDGIGERQRLEEVAEEWRLRILALCSSGRSLRSAGQA